MEPKQLERQTYIALKLQFVLRKFRNSFMQIFAEITNNELRYKDVRKSPTALHLGRGLRNVSKNYMDLFIHYKYRRLGLISKDFLVV